MTYTFDEYQLSEMLTTAAKMGAQQLAVEQGLVKTQISRSEAYRRHSKRIIDRLINDGKVKVLKNGARTLLSVVEIETALSTNSLWQKHIKPVVK